MDAALPLDLRFASNIFHGPDVEDGCGAMEYEDVMFEVKDLRALENIVATISRPRSCMTSVSRLYNICIS